jgi:hypothetical protein
MSLRIRLKSIKCVAEINEASASEEPYVLLSSAHIQRTPAGIDIHNIRVFRYGVREDFDVTPEIVGLRVEFQEFELQHHVKQAGGKWNSTMRVWEIHYDQAVALGLEQRIVKLEVSDIRHHQVSNTRHRRRPHN